MEDIDKNATKQETYDQFTFNEEQSNMRGGEQHMNQSEMGDASMISFSFGGNQLQDNAAEEVTFSEQKEPSKANSDASTSNLKTITLDEIMLDDEEEVNEDDNVEEPTISRDAEVEEDEDYHAVFVNAIRRKEQLEQIEKDTN